jgi:hypothetical protein
MITDSAFESTSSVDVVELQNLKNRVVEIRQQISELQAELTAKERQLKDLGRRFIQEIGLSTNGADSKPRGAASKSKAARRKGDKKAASAK